MNRNFTRLVCAGIASFCMMSAMGQESTVWWPDSVVRYNYLGEPTRKEYYDEENRTGGLSILVDGVWESFGQGFPSEGYAFEEMTVVFREYEGEIGLGIPYIHFSVHWATYSKEEFSCNTTYDDKKNLILLEIIDKDTSVIERWQMKYNENNKLLSAERYYYDTLSYKYLYEYDGNGNPICLKQYQYSWISDSMEMIDLIQIKYDEKGRPVEGYSLSLENEEYTTYHVFYYSDATATPGTAIEDNTFIGDTNEGGFDLNVNVPADSIASGSVTVTLLEGLTLDETNTTLAVDVAGLFDLTITKQENNSWLIAIKLKSDALKSDALKADEALGAMLHVAYKVEDTLPRGTYNISVNSILFETPFGNMIPEPAIIVPANINRWAVANEQISDQETEVYITGNTLYINTPLPDVLSIYTAAGIKVYEATVPAGASTVSTANFPQGMLILQGKSGWVKKVVN